MSGYSTGRKRPFTGEEYLESLRDGREIWIYGERVKDVTTHPAFRNTVRMIARLYDALHDPARRDVLTSPTDTGSGGYTHKFYRAPHNAEEMVGDRDAIAEWARVSYGWIGRSPDYNAAFMATLGANSAFYEQYEENAKRWYERALTRIGREGAPLLIIDNFVDTLAEKMWNLGLSLRGLQTGKLRQYVMFIVVGTIVLFAVASVWRYAIAAG